uniref:Uncharacterized protein n=1 Tax=Timema tahoe TaxID=61484 RepID=A0A7R9IF44_9NEOP|nr:unnamed protein product [Timema tahoe]
MSGMPLFHMKILQGRTSYLIFLLHHQRGNVPPVVYAHVHIYSTEGLVSDKLSLARLATSLLLAHARVEGTSQVLCLLGVLIAWPEKLSVVAGLKATSVGSTVENPSILPLCTTAPWFPLLPVTSHHPQTSLKKAASPKPKGDPSAGDIVRSGAAALFGVMSSDWFGSS